MLDTISKPLDREALITICGDSGLGKTTLASTFPNPIIIRAEDGLQAIPKEIRPDAFPLVDDESKLWLQLKSLINDEHDYKTLVIDSVTALERLFIQYVVDSDPKNPRSINQALGGYGAGLNAVAAMHHRVRKASGILNERRKMHVVFVAHADTETIELPDQDAYTRYNLRLGKKSVAPYVDDVDLVGFLKLETYLKDSDSGKSKAVSSGERVLVTYASAANVSKNRYGITDNLTVDIGVNPLLDYIPALTS